MIPKMIMSIFKRTVHLLLALALCVSFAGCAGRNVIYKRENTIVLSDEDSDEEQASMLPNVTQSATLEPGETAGPENTNTYKFTGEAFCIINASTGEIVLSDNAYEINYIASITKILTCLVALEWVEPDEKIRLESGWLDVLKKDQSIECYGLKEGSSYYVKDMVSMALVKSLGDAAVALGKIAESRSGIAFEELMNEKASELGMTASSFDNPIGLDIGNNYTKNYSTAYDATKLLAAALTDETIMSAVSGKTVYLTNGVEMKNPCSLLTNGSGSDNYTMLGGKTGSTKAAGSCLTVAAQNRNNGDIYVVVYLHGSNATVVINEIKTMLEYICVNS